MEMEIFSAGGRKVNAHTRGFTICTDQSVKGGGEGSAPEPFTLFLSSIGTCAGVFVYAFCAARNIAVDNLKIIQQSSYDPKTKMVDTFVLEIQIPDNFPEKYEAAIIRAADLCPVKKHLHPSIHFDIHTKRIPDMASSSR